MNALSKLLLILVFMVSTYNVFSQQHDSFTVVYNNMPSANNLKADWGYAVWIEKDGKIILFDTGTKANLLQKNFEKLNLDPTQIDVIAISHDHYDHTGGLETVLGQIKNGTKVYLPNDYKPELRDEFSKLKFVVNDKYQKIADGVWLTDIFIEKSRGIREQALVLELGEGVIVITGCAHPGIARMCESVKNHFPNKKLELVTGGFHLMRTSEEEVVQISDKIKRLGFKRVAPSHCTGDNSIAIFKNAWGEDFVQLNLGDSYHF